VVGHLLHHVSATGGHQRCRLTSTIEPRGTDPGAAQHEDHQRESGHVEVEGARSEIDVVAEHRCNFVAEYRAADIRQHAHVVERRHLRRVEPQSITEAQTDPRRAQLVLERLPEAEIRRKRHRRQQLGKAHSGRRHPPDRTSHRSSLGP